MLRLATVTDRKLTGEEQARQSALYLREMCKVSSQAVRDACSDLSSDCEFFPPLATLKKSLWHNERRLNPPVAAVEYRPGPDRAEQTHISAEGAVKICGDVHEVEANGTIGGKPALKVLGKLGRAMLDRAGYDPETAARVA
jgi:hypothetical protein